MLTVPFNRNLMGQDTTTENGVIRFDYQSQFASNQSSRFLTSRPQ